MPAMKRTLPAFAIVLGAACASGGSSGSGVTTSARPTQTMSILGGGAGNTMTISATGAGPVVNSIGAAADRVWRVLPAAFDSLGIPVTRVDQAQKVIGNDGLKIRQKLKSTPLSRFIDCGQTQIGPNADSYEVHLVLLVQVKPVAGSTTASSIETNFEAAARPLTFSQGYSRCTTTTQLEKRLLDAVNAQLK
jgi:hypothetical protein